MPGELWREFVDIGGNASFGSEVARLNHKHALTIIGLLAWTSLNLIFSLVRMSEKIAALASCSLRCFLLVPSLEQGELGAPGLTEEGSIT